MARKQSVQRNVIERFADMANPAAMQDMLIEESQSESSKQNLRRFLKMVANRRQQILERMLMDEE